MQSKFKLKPIYQARVKNLFKKPKQKKKNKALLDKMHDEWFFKLEPEYFVAMNKEWNERNLKIEIVMQADYDDWLNYFKTMPVSHLKILASTSQEFLSSEAYAALSRWHDIIGNPHRIDKIHQSGLTKQKANKEFKSITQLAQSNDRMGVLKATRDKIAEKLDKGAGSRDTALLTREMTEIMTQIADYEKRLGPKKTTLLGRLLNERPEHVGKRPSQNGKGSRHTTFKSRVTIKDLE